MLNCTFAITEKVVVCDEGKLVVVLLDGTEVECVMEQKEKKPVGVIGSP